MLYLAAILAGVIADQLVKNWTVSNLALYEAKPFLPGIVELMYIQNTGGGFSIMEGRTWLLAALTVVLMVALAVILWKKVYDHPLAMWSLTLVLSGGIGNLIDRVRLGYVVDMFNFQFMNYPVFNVADILVVVGAVGFAAYYLLLDEKIRKAKTAKEEKDDHGTDHPADNG